MQVITLILAVVAFAASVLALIIAVRVMRELNTVFGNQTETFKRLLTKHREFMQKYVTEAISVSEEKAASVEQKKLEEAAAAERKLKNAIRVACTKADAAVKATKEQGGRIERLEQGIVPDFNEALRAVNAVNDMNSGIANIFGFDPLEAIKKGRQEGG